MVANSDISVLWVSRCTLFPGMHNLVHTHNYFHFSCVFNGRIQMGNGTTPDLPLLTCDPPEKPHGGMRFLDVTDSINVMFLVRDKSLYKSIENFPFSSVEPEHACLPLLQTIVEQAGSLLPDVDLLNSAFSYYLRLLIHTNRFLTPSESSPTPAERCISYINENYMYPITLEDIATHIERNRSYTSSLFSTAYGMTLVEYLSAVRIQHACALIAYSDISIKDVPAKCGFSDQRNFGRVFKSVVGITPQKYRNTHMVKDLLYDGDINELKHRRPDAPMFTYVANAQKRIDWASGYDYILQRQGTAPQSKK